MKTLHQAYSTTHGLSLLRELAGEGNLIFDVAAAKKAAKRVRMPASYLSEALSRLSRTEWLKRLRRGLYATSGTIAGGLQVHPFAIATRLVAPSAISHWSAMSHHGLTEQIPRHVTAMTTTKVITPSMRRGAGRCPGKHTWDVLGVRYEYVVVRQGHYFGIEEVWVDQAFKVPMTDKERTALEAFISPGFFGGLSQGIAILEEHRGDLDLEKLVKHALTYGKASVIKRLGWALEECGAPEKSLRPLRNVPVSGFRILDPTRPKRGQCIARWMVQDNVTNQGDSE